MIQASAQQLHFIGGPLDLPLLLIAAPGSGKTFALKYRLLYLSKMGVDLSRVLVSMFNKPPAKELKTDIQKMGLPAEPIVIHYHSLAAKMVAKQVALGNMEPWELIDSELYFTNLARTALLEIQKDVKDSKCDPHNKDVIDSFVAFIKLTKSDIQGPEAAFKQFDIYPPYYPFVDAYHLYEKIRKQRKVRSFDDLFCDLAALFQRNPGAVKRVENYFDHIIIDEYQDINAIIYFVFKTLAGSRAKITGIGDDDQTINSFRGSRPDYLTHIFAKENPTTKQFYITRTFRYGHAISLLSNNVIANNKNRIPKLCVSAPQTPKSQVSISYYPDNLAVPYTCPEQTALIEKIKSALNKGFQYKDIAILLRLYVLSPYIEMALLRHNVPYDLVDKSRICDRTIFTALMAMFTLHPRCTASDDVKMAAFKWTMRFPWLSLPDEILESLAPMVLHHETLDENKLDAILENEKTTIAKTTASRIRSLINAFDQSETPYAFIAAYRKLHLDALLDINEDKPVTLTARERVFMVNNFSEMAQSHESFDSFRNALLNLIKASKHSDHAIKIMSIHKSKGLSIPVVIVPGCVESIMPASAIGRVMDIEDERRLFYVAVTRAVQHLHLITANDRKYKQALMHEDNTPKGEIEISPRYSSRFMYESNINSATRVADAIYNNRTNPLSSSSSAGLINQYLLEIESYLRIKND